MTHAQAHPREFPLFEAALGASFVLHAAIWAFLNHHPAARDFIPAVIDVDVRTPFRPRSPDDKSLPGRAKGAPAPEKYKSPLPVLAPPPPVLQPPPQVMPKPQENEPGTAVEKPKEWQLSPNGKGQQAPTLEGSPPVAVPVHTAPGGTGIGGENGRGGSGGGDGTGEAIVNRPARLINAEEIKAQLRRFYPLAERQADHEGQVIIGVQVGADGLVHGVEVLESAGYLFDDAAASVAKLMRFEPKLVRSVPTAAKVKVPITFQLKD